MNAEPERALQNLFNVSSQPAEILRLTDKAAGAPGLLLKHVRFKYVCCLFTRDKEVQIKKSKSNFVGPPVCTSRTEAFVSAMEFQGEFPGWVSFCQNGVVVNFAVFGFL